LEVAVGQVREHRLVSRYEVVSCDRFWEILQVAI